MTDIPEMPDETLAKQIAEAQASIAERPEWMQKAARFEGSDARKPAPTHAPVYAAMYPTLAQIARDHGYALAIHGSLQRDFDLICVPWTDSPSDPDVVLDAMCDEYVIRRINTPTLKPHGRVAYTLSIQFGECAADISFMPRVARMAPACDLDPEITG